MSDQARPAPDRRLPWRIAAWTLAAATVAAMVLVNGAVGIIGDAENPANLMYAGVVAVAVLGAVVARFRTRGMARVMAVAAFVQGVVAVFALTGGFGSSALSAAFGVLWLASAALFRRASHR